MTTTQTLSRPADFSLSASHRRLFAKIRATSLDEASDPTATPLDPQAAPGAVKALTRLASTWGYAVTFGKTASPDADGETDLRSGKITLNRRLIGFEATHADVLAHELAHVWTYRSGALGISIRDRATSEITAEAIADGVTSFLGIDHSAAHAHYIANWSITLPPAPETGFESLAQILGFISISYEVQAEAAIDVARKAIVGSGVKQLVSAL